MSTSQNPAPGTDQPAADPAAAATTRPARTADRAPAGERAAADTTPGTLPRWADRRQAAPLAKIGMIVFSIGLVSIAVSLVLFATGRENLPLWLNLISMLAPLGLAIGLVGVVKEARAASPALVQRKLDKESAKAAAAGDPSEEWNLPDLAAKQAGNGESGSTPTEGK